MTLHLEEYTRLLFTEVKGDENTSDYLKETSHGTARSQISFVADYVYRNILTLKDMKYKVHTLIVADLNLRNTRFKFDKLHGYPKLLPC